MLFGYFTLFVALVISAVAAYYSIVGLTAIFSAAVIPIMIMGASLEVGKLVAAVWLKLNWHRASITYKLYLVPAVAFLMLLTSMGIFGFLSKAHSDQGLVSGDSMAKVAIYDEKINTAKENIAMARKALKQMDESVDQVMGRSNDEKGADKAVAIRRGQQKERTKLLAEIELEQRKISQLSEERAPFAAEFRKVESEVGPIKYIAALVYGDNPDANVLEKAVRWVIILIVAVFDPLALVLILAAQQTLRWERENKELNLNIVAPEEDRSVEITKDTQAAETEQPLTEYVIVEAEGEPVSTSFKFTDPGEHPKDDLEYQTTEPEAKPEENIFETHPYLLKPFDHFRDTTPLVYKPEPLPKPEIYSGNPDDFKEPWTDKEKADLVKAMETFFDQNKEAPTSADESKILVMGVDVIDRPGDYITESEVSKFPKIPETAKRHKDPAPVVPEAVNVNKSLGLQADNSDAHEAKSDFGTAFPASADKGDMFLRVDYLPNKLFKFNGQKWIEVDKSKTDSYTYDEQYIQFLIEKLQSGEYEIDQLSASEQELVAEQLQRIANDKNT